MTEVLELLVALQKTDDEIARLQELKTSIPELMLQIDENVAKEERAFEQLQDRLEEHQKRQARLELDIQSARDAVKKYKNQLLSVKTNKEYTALFHEIQSKENDIERFEESLLVLMDEIEQLEKEVGSMRIEIDRLREEAEEEKQKLQRQLDQAIDDLPVKLDERKRFSARLSPELSRMYERIREGRGGNAVVGVRDGACSGCFVAIPPQERSEIKRGDTLKVCGNCGRILIWEMEEV